jgi:hypothetical protein
MTWESYQAWIWFAVEAHLAVVCASAPALKIYFKQAVGGSGWNSYPSRPSFGQSKGFKSTTTDTDESPGNSKTRRSDDLPIGRMESEEKLRPTFLNISEEEDDETGTVNDIELGNFDRHEERVGEKPQHRASRWADM